MKVSEKDRTELANLGLLIDIPEDIPRAFLIFFRDSEDRIQFDKEIFWRNAAEWTQIGKYELTEGMVQIVAKPKDAMMEDFIVLAVSTDYLAGEASEGFFGYFILTKEEWRNIEDYLINEIQREGNGLHLFMINTIRQGFKDEKAYLNFFGGITHVDCQDDGMFSFIATKRKLPVTLRAALDDMLTVWNWDEAEYNSEGFTGSQEIIILRDVFEPREKAKERLEKVNKIIMEAV